MLFVTSKDNSNVKKAVKLKSSAKERRKSGLFLAEGLRICMDAVFSGAEIQTLFVTEKAMQKHGEDFALLEEKAKNVICVNENIFSLMSDTQSPQGFLSVIKTLDKTNEFDTIMCRIQAISALFCARQRHLMSAELFFPVTVAIFTIQRL